MDDIGASGDLSNINSNVNQYISDKMGYSIVLLLQIRWNDRSVANRIVFKFIIGLLYIIGIRLSRASILLTENTEAKDRARGKSTSHQIK